MEIISQIARYSRADSSWLHTNEPDVNWTFPKYLKLYDNPINWWQNEYSTFLMRFAAYKKINIPKIT